MATVINHGDIYQRGDLSNKLTRHNDARVWRLAEQLPVHGEGVQSVGKPSSPGGTTYRTCLHSMVARSDYS